MNGRVCAEGEDKADEGDGKIYFGFASETHEGECGDSEIADLGAIYGEPKISRATADDGWV